MQDLSGGTVRYAPVLTRDLSRLACLSDFPEVVAFDADDATYGLTVAESSNQLVRFRLEQNWVDVGSADLTRTLLRPDFQAPLDGGVELAGKPLAADEIDRWLALALVTLAADAAGAMRQGMQDAVEYSKVRVQYGVPIGSFQAIQHLCADMLVQVASTTSAINYAAWAVDELEPKEALLAARVAKAYSSLSAMNVSETVMQIYGGIGQTWEHIAHFVTRRTLLDRQVFGDAPHQFRAIADLRLETIHGKAKWIFETHPRRPRSARSFGIGSPRTPLTAIRISKTTSSATRWPSFFIECSTRLATWASSGHKSMAGVA